MLLYVDDMLIATKNKTHVQKLKAQLKKEFNVKDLREVKKILGMEIARDRSSGRLWLSQENYALKVLKTFNMAEARLSRLASQNTLGRRREESRRRIYAKKMPHVYALSLK